MKQFIGKMLRIIKAVFRRIRINPKKFFVPKNNLKKVSVVIPNYNYARFLEERIDSILAQTYPIYELIILDDASTDESAEVISRIVDQLKNTKRNLPKIRTVINKQNSGNVFKQWDKAFEESEGDYLWIAEADDLSDKHFLNVAMRGFDKNKYAIISCVESKTIDESSKKISKDTRDWSGLSYRNFHMKGKEFIAKHLAIKNTIVNVSGLVFRKGHKTNFHKLLSTAREFDNTGDWYFYEKLLMEGDIVYNAESLNSFRLHSHSVTHSKSHAAHFNEILKMQEICAEDVNLPRETILQKQDYLIKQKNDWWLSGDEVFYDRLDLGALIKKRKMDKDSILLSVIIPVYNTADYLDLCINSALADLPYNNVEVIIVDDGSTDGSGEIIKRLEKRYNNIKYLYQKHKGQSIAKQNGLDHAKGEYVIYLDSDDYVETGAYSLMLKKALEKEADIVCCDFCVVYQDGNKVLQKSINKDNSVPILTGLADCALMASLCNKMVRREIYQGVYFPEGVTRYEDVARAPLILAKAKKISYMEAPLYNYVLREKSVNSDFDDSVYDIFEIVKKCMDKLKNTDFETYSILGQSLIIHQIVAPILWRIAELNDIDRKRKEIIKFCTKYNSYNFDFENGENVTRYLLRSGKPDLIKAIHNNDYDKIANMV